MVARIATVAAVMVPPLVSPALTSCAGRRRTRATLLGAGVPHVGLARRRGSLHAAAAHPPLLGEQVIAQRLGLRMLQEAQHDRRAPGVARRLHLHEADAQDARQQLLTELHLLHTAEGHRPMSLLQDAFLEHELARGHRVGAEPPPHEAIPDEGEAEPDPDPVDALAEEDAEDRR